MNLVRSLRAAKQPAIIPQSCILLALSIAACSDQTDNTTQPLDTTTNDTSSSATASTGTLAPTGTTSTGGPTGSPTGQTGTTTGPSGATGTGTGGTGASTGTDTNGSSGGSGGSGGSGSSDSTAPISTSTDTSASDTGSDSGSTSNTRPPSNCVPDGRARNPLVSHIFTADPNATVYGDRVYLYVSHDVDNQENYDMVDYRAFSSDDMVNWQDHGVIIHAKDLPWAQNLYAPGACSKNGKYYLYMPNGGSSIGVAVSDNPGGPFVDPIKKALITKDFPNANVPWLFDPACFVDDDGQGYMYFGGGDDSGQNARVIRLNDDMISLKDERATTIQTTAFFEASFMHKHEGKYYFSYSSDFSAEHGAALEYLMGDNPMGPFTYKGKFLPNHNINNGNNNHGSIIEFKGKTYVFYHARKLMQQLGTNKVNNRSVGVQEITYANDGSLNQITMSTQDFTVSQIKCLDGFDEVQAETLAAEKGIEVEGNAGETVRVSAISNDDWVGYSQVDFRDGAKTLVLRVASAQGGGKINVSLDDCITGDAGESVGSCDVVATGGATTFAELRCPITAPAGAHDLCLKFTNSPAFELDSWHLEE